jgi:hypothetical protein
VPTTGCGFPSFRENATAYTESVGDDRVLHKPEEEQSALAGVAAIEAESKFIEIGIQRCGCH